MVFGLRTRIDFGSVKTTGIPVVAALEGAGQLQRCNEGFSAREFYDARRALVAFLRTCSSSADTAGDPRENQSIAIRAM